MLTIVKLPSSVVTVSNAVFQTCYALTTVVMPGCLFLGARLFAECCALEQVGVLTVRPCRLACGATISPYAFEGCIRLAQIGLPRTRAAAGIQELTSPSEFFFPRVRTPCGHGAQVIVEGREVSQMVEKITRTTNKKPTEHQKGPQAASPPSCSLSSVLGETGETEKSV